MQTLPTDSAGLTDSLPADLDHWLDAILIASLISDEIINCIDEAFLQSSTEDELEHTLWTDHWNEEFLDANDDLDVFLGQQHSAHQAEDNLPNYDSERNCWLCLDCISNCDCAEAHSYGS